MFRHRNMTDDLRAGRGLRGRKVADLGTPAEHIAVLAGRKTDPIDKRGLAWDRDGNFGAGGCRNRLRCVRLQHSNREPAPRRGTDTMIEQQPAVDTTVLSLSDAAALKLRELTKEETNPNIGLRVYVYSGGCSGFRYGMMLEDQPTPEDNILEVNGTKVYVDTNSIPLLKGSEIDYVDTLMGAGFTVNNPNAVAACGCGSSFRTADDTGTARSCAH